MYYIYAIRSWAQNFSWQVRFSYAIILMCIVTMLILMLLFTRHIRRRKQYQKNYQHCMNTYGEAFLRILNEDSRLTPDQMLEECDATRDDIAQYDGLLYAEIICNLRMSMHERLYFLNLQGLCELTGAHAALELNLKRNHHVLRTLQIINTLPMDINEGALAVYTSHRNQRISRLARITHVISSESEPYLYFLEDMNHPQPPSYRITIHRLLGWKRAQNLPMPPLSMLASTCKDPQMAAFLIEEIAFWGSEAERDKLPTYFYDQRITCRLAAVKAITRLGRSDAEQQIIDSYNDQPQDVRRVMQRALASFHSGRHTDFFVNLYLNTPSHESRSIALDCLFDYNEEGRARFEQLCLEATPEEHVLFEQIRTTHRLAEVRNPGDTLTNLYKESNITST